ncbi:hypothetical protein KIN20_013845 [Parelaphostrongylus tenuis]|uniref:Uncharacterized protein n=1 Tax=Parelaphostrongylus tenuis TaxID=148309 RepID=A0AAD5MYP4_PARTN|nr:hypothetical protein KIN20_013845 [Parelaphostrongylus tenuis]
MSSLGDVTNKKEDDHWIFEQLGSPEKPANESNTSRIYGDSVEQVRSNFEKNLRTYADNMRKLIITARKEISDLKVENTSLKQKLQSSGLTECPACLYRFKPEREHRILPKYIKVFRPKLSLEIEFSSLEKMKEWLMLNELGENADGIPTMMQCEDRKPDLESTGSLIHRLVKEKQEIEAKKKKVVINIPPRDRHPSTAANRSSSDPSLIMSNSAEQRPSNVLEIECISDECPDDDSKEGVKDPFPSLHLITSSNIPPRDKHPSTAANSSSSDPSLIMPNAAEQRPSKVLEIECISDKCPDDDSKEGVKDPFTSSHLITSSERNSSDHITNVSKNKEVIKRQPWRRIPGKGSVSGVLNEHQNETRKTDMEKRKWSQSHNETAVSQRHIAKRFQREDASGRCREDSDRHESSKKGDLMFSAFL